MSKPTPWIIGYDGTQGELAYALECKRCGDIQKVALPLIVDCYLAMSKAFIKIHRQCKDETQPPV